MDFDTLLDNNLNKPEKSENGITINFKEYKRPKIILNIKYGERHLWHLFHKHHYLDGNLNKSSQVFSIYWDDVLVGFNAYIPSPGTVNNLWRGHRLVVLPEFQGLGFGGVIPEIISQYQIDSLGRKVYAVTTHPKLGNYRNNSIKWVANSSNGKPGVLADYGSTGGAGAANQIRLGIITYSHVYKGPGKKYTLHSDPLKSWDMKTKKAREKTAGIGKAKRESQKKLKEMKIDEW